MGKPVYFKDWISGLNWAVRLALFFILLSTLMQFGMFAMTQNYVMSAMGAQPEDISFALLLTNVGIVSILPLVFRFIRYFETRSYLLVNIVFGILLHIVCINCTDIYLFFIVRFLQGTTVACTAACLLMLIMSRLPAERMQAVSAAVFYGVILGNATVIGLIASFVINNADWKLTYYILIFIQLLAMIVTLITLKRTSGHKSYPLYLIDWPSSIMICCATSAVAYTMIYGSKYYWFADQRIVSAVSVCIICLGVFIYRQLTIKRPLINLNVFKSTNFIVGICLLAIYYGSKDSINLIFSYAGGVLKWNPTQVITLGCVNIMGMVLALSFSTLMMIRNRGSIKVLVCTGLTVLVLHHLWIYFELTPDLSFRDLMLPVIFQGIASGLLFVPIVIFCLSSAAPNTGTAAVVVAAYIRFIGSLNSMAGFYNLQLYFNQYFRDGFLRFLTTDDQNTAVRLNNYRQLYISKGIAASQAADLANSALGQSLAQQSQLLTIRAIFMVLAILLSVVCILLLSAPFINKTYLHWSKRMFTWPRG